EVEIKVERADKIDYGPTPMASIPKGHAKSFHIPAPRGLIVSSEGEPLAINEVKFRVVVQLPIIAANAKEAITALEELTAGVAIPWLNISEHEMVRHFQHRIWVPLPITPTLEKDELALIHQQLPKGMSLDPVYERSYPQKELFAHLIGYIGDSLPDQHGPIGEVEYAWPPLMGRAGMEKTLHEDLTGIDGIVERLYDAQGNLLNQEIARPPRPGNTVVLSINLAMQKKAEEALAKTGRPGAFVAVDADTGDILAMVSYPSFDPNLFIGGIPETTYRELADREDAPFFDRAVLGEYPPGSTFKPFVALAGTEWGTVDGLETKYSGPPVVLIAGRPFKNWSSESEGMMDLRYALMRSCNTWFYQAAIQMGPFAIADVSRRFGLGAKPQLPLPAVSSGHIPNPEIYGDLKSLANFSIGQGRVLASPLQMALAMAALANGTHVPKPRLVVESLDPLTHELVDRVPPEVAHPLHLDPADLEWVREGMWGVVNHGRGTAGRASMAKPVVYGKTGTSEWAEDSEKRSLAWFTGWVDTEKPRIAFAAITQGRRWETLSGGRSAAPIAATVLRDAYQNPEQYLVTLPEGPPRPNPRLTMPLPVVVDITPDEGRPFGRVGGLFKMLFGQRRSEPAEDLPLPEESGYIMELTAP
ncbi:MAG: penicillin-binding transpeptidase domain-containing protein, partial [Verrucomicrobiales bacterium]|nr:penicillin-binding transpeptidase domain-containing protein [Verrucomicrobiales bacterium]